MRKTIIKETTEKFAKRKLKRKVSPAEAERLLKISRFGKACRIGKIDEKIVKKFLEERKLEILSEELPDATKGISKKAGIFSKAMKKDAVLDYFFGKHNNFLLERIKLSEKQKKIDTAMIKDTKGITELISKFRKHMVNVGTVVKKHETNFVVKLPNGNKLVVQSDVPIVGDYKKVLIHDGYIVDYVNKKEFDKYSKFYKGKLRDKLKKK